MTTPIKRLRRLTGLTQATVAAMVGTDPRTLRRWENGEAEVPLMYRMLLEAVSRDTSANSASLSPAWYLAWLSERGRQP
jgi:DNA-binding transcriptional regulator YiaG